MGSKGTYDTPQVCLLCCELRQDVLHHELLDASLDIGMAHDEGAEDSYHCERTEALRRCSISIWYPCQSTDIIKIFETHERKTVLTNWSMGRKDVLVRLLARESRNEVAPLTGEEKFSYSSGVDVSIGHWTEDR
jgi:hypothetical protein